MELSWAFHHLWLCLFYGRHWQHLKVGFSVSGKLLRSVTPITQTFLLWEKECIYVGTTTHWLGMSWKFSLQVIVTTLLCVLFGEVLLGLCRNWFFHHCSATEKYESLDAFWHLLHVLDYETDIKKMLCKWKLDTLLFKDYQNNALVKTFSSMFLSFLVIFFSSFPQNGSEALHSRN